MDDFYQEILKHFITEEGYRDKPYLDSHGVLTIGIGHNLNNPLCKKSIQAQFDCDFQLALDAAKRVYGPDIWKDLGDYRQLALISMAFQLGEKGLSEFKRMLEALRRGDFKSAHDEALLSDWAEQMKRSGRARRVAYMLLTNRLLLRERE